MDGMGNEMEHLKKKQTLPFLWVHERHMFYSFSSSYFSKGIFEIYTNS